MFGLSTLLATALITATPQAGTQNIVLYQFTTPNCAPCERIEPVVQAYKNAKYPIETIVVTRENATRINETYGIRVFPSFIMYLNDTPIGRIDGETDHNVLNEKFRQLFEQARLQAKHNIEMANQTISNVPAIGNVLLERGKSPWESATVRLKVIDPNGFSNGTGTIIDVRKGKALILTCGHIFRDSNGLGEVEVYIYGENGQVKTSGRCIHHNIQRDLAFVIIEPPVPVRGIELAPVKFDLRDGDTVVSLGCSGGDDPSQIRHRVISQDKVLNGQAEPRFAYIQVEGAPVQGRSGGGLFSENGYLLGVCNTGDPIRGDGHFVPFNIIRNELQIAQINSVARSQSLFDPEIGQKTENPIMLASGTSERFASNVPSLEIPEVPAQIHQIQTPSPTPSVKFTTMNELARKHQEGAEIICIVRSRDKKNEETLLLRDNGLLNPL